MALLQTIYRSLLNGVEGLQGQGTIILELLEAIKCAPLALVYAQIY